MDNYQLRVCRKYNGALVVKGITRRGRGLIQSKRMVDGKFYIQEEDTSGTPLR